MQSDKLESLKEKIESASLKDLKHKGSSNQQSSDSIKIATELVSGVLVGVFLGAWLDKVFDSKPLLLIICSILGIITSIRAVQTTIGQKNGS